MYLRARKAYIHRNKAISTQMGWSEMEGRCNKHPKHRQSPGVCSFCLRERLSHLSSSSSSSTNTRLSVSCSSSVSSHSSFSASLMSSSPPHLSSVLASATKGLFGRSRSMTVVARHGEGVVVENKKKKGRFWSKLLRPRNRRRKEDDLLHSKTMKEVPTTFWALSRKWKGRLLFL